MKKIEKDILNILKTNARIPAADIAEMLSISEKEATQTIEKLEKEGVLIQYTTVVNEEKFNGKDGTVRALIEIRVRPEKRSGFDTIAKRIAKHKNVIDLYLISGQYDFMVVMEGKSLQEVSGFVSDILATMGSIVSTATHFIMRKYKEKGVLLEKESVRERLAVSP